VIVPDFLPGRSLLPILEQPDPAGGDETFFSHCFHGVIEYNPYRVLRGRRYKLVRTLAHDFQVSMPTDLFRSQTWQAILKQKIERMGCRPTSRLLHRDAEELYDLQNDPMETRNPVNDPKVPCIVADLRRKLMDFRLNTRDPWPELSRQRGEPGAVADVAW
jgi:N-sulfoglucosamine sulfohydrolase